MSKKSIISIVLLIVIGLLYFFIVKPFFGSNVKASESSKIVYIPTNATYDDVLTILNEADLLINLSDFQLAAKLMSYDKIKPGRYEFTPGMSNQQLVSKLRSGNQDPQNVTINNIRLISDLAGKASRYFEADSFKILSYLTNPATPLQYGLNQDNFLTMFIPNTYDMFWTATPEKFVARMKKEYDRFWNSDRLAKLSSKNIDKTQAYIVASIVEKESNYDPERPRIAGVYLNRLKNGEKLQADPTVVFATGDFTIQRVLYSHLETDSPYNTYKYAGLPPGPICMPSLASLEAVINAEDHKYMFFCAKADNSGIHAFAETYEDHQKNAAAFAKWLNTLNIK